MAQLPRNLACRIILQARAMELAEQPVLVAVVHPSPPVEDSFPTLLCFYSSPGQGVTCKLANFDSSASRFGPPVTLHLAASEDASAVLGSLMELMERSLPINEQDDAGAHMLWGLTNTKVATDILSKREWPRGMQKELISLLVLSRGWATRSAIEMYNRLMHYLDIVLL